MTDYAKHIDEIETLKYACDGQYDECLGAAIELLRATQPKSAEEERAYCEHIANVVQTWEDKVFAYTESRAAARAEGYADGAAVYHTAGLQHLNDLAAAQAEIERLRENAELETKLNNLRETAEQAVWELSLAKEKNALRAAIEASR